MAALKFPICLLTQGESIKERVKNIIDFAIVNEAKKIQDESLVHDFWDDDHTGEIEWDPDNLIHKKILIISVRKEATIYNCFSVFKNYKIASGHINEFELKYGKDMWTRIGVNIAWDTLNGDFNYELFAILCAINGILGAKDAYKRISVERIRAAMNGCKKHSIYHDISQSGNLPDKNLSEIKDRTLYRRLDKLSKMNFFRRYTYKNRHTYYSTRIHSLDKLAHTVNELKSNLKRDREINQSFEQDFYSRKLSEFLKS